jgi:osmotically inducible lipoprotein OsmB
VQRALTANAKDGCAIKPCLASVNKSNSSRCESPGVRSLKRNDAMNTLNRFTLGTVAAALLLGLGGCAGMSAQDKSTAIGAGVGAVGGAVLTGGSAVGTVGGAAVGGVIGHEVAK